MSLIEDPLPPFSKTLAHSKELFSKVNDAFVKQFSSELRDELLNEMRTSAEEYARIQDDFQTNR